MFSIIFSLVFLTGAFLVASQCFIPPPELKDRNAWKATPASRPHKEVGYRVPNFVVTLNTDSPECIGNVCASVVRSIQKEHMDKGCNDIQYNFLISRDGIVWEGRGWKTRTCEHLEVPKGITRASPRLDVALIGDWRYHQNPPVEMADALMMLLNEGIRRKYLSKNYIYFDLDYRYEPSSDKTDEEEYDPVVK